MSLHDLREYAQLRSEFDAHAQGVGAIALADGSFLDVAMVERARRTLALALATEVAQD